MADSICHLPTLPPLFGIADKMADISHLRHLHLPSQKWQIYLLCQAADMADMADVSANYHTISCDYNINIARQFSSTLV